MAEHERELTTTPGTSPRVSALRRSAWRYARAPETASRASAVRRPLRAVVHRRRRRAAAGSPRSAPMRTGRAVAAARCRPSGPTPPRGPSGSTTSSSRRAPAGIAPGGHPGRGPRRPRLAVAVDRRTRVVYEIDQPQGARIQEPRPCGHTAHGRSPATSPSPSTCARTGQRRCATAGFDAIRADRVARPRDCCRTCPRTAQDLLFERIQRLSAPDSRHRRRGLRIATSSTRSTSERAPGRHAGDARRGRQDRTPRWPT